MNSRRIKQLRYVFGDASEVLSGETMASWITGSSNGQVTLDQEKVAAFVANLAATYDTAGKARTFRGVTGAEYSLQALMDGRLTRQARSQPLLS